MTVLDTNIVGIILPTIASDLRASFAEMEWVVSAYVLCFTALLLPAGTIADRYGRRRVFLLGIFAFAIASLACGLAPTVRVLSVARAAQGIGAAFLLAPALAIIGHTFHEETGRNRAWAIWGSIMGLAMVASPLLGGVVTAWWGWRWAFHLNIPICLLLAVALVKTVPESRDPSPRSLDMTGMILFGATMLGATWALIHGPGNGWTSWSVALPALGAVAGLLCFVMVERRLAHPMLDLRLFASRRFAGAVVAMFAYAASAQVMASLLPLYLQNGRGYAALEAGIGMLPFALAMLAFPFVGRTLSRRLDSFQILTIGLIVVAVGNLALMACANDASVGGLLFAMALLGAGGGLLNGETQKAIMGTVPRDRAGMAAGISTTARFSGILLGFTALGAVLAGGLRIAMVDKMGARVAFEPEVLDAMAAGDFDRALSSFPESSAPWIAGMAGDGYNFGFSMAFLTAAAIATAATVIVFLTSRQSQPVTRDPVHAKRI